ncbi:hypothetical protein [Nonomuraea salmonea]|uniref:hypothetical protein n=1 Tax=Nonomuraea salmonea TaxID=46181 RepID=UPI0031EFCCAB
MEVAVQVVDAQFEVVLDVLLHDHRETRRPAAHEGLAADDLGEQAHQVAGRGLDEVLVQHLHHEPVPFQRLGGAGGSVVTIVRGVRTPAAAAPASCARRPARSPPGRPAGGERGELADQGRPGVGADQRTGVPVRDRSGHRAARPHDGRTEGAPFEGDQAVVEGDRQRVPPAVRLGGVEAYGGHAEPVQHGLQRGELASGRAVGEHDPRRALLLRQPPDGGGRRRAQVHGDRRRRPGRPAALA